MNDITYSDQITPAEYNMLRKSAGWREICAEQAQAAVSNSGFITVARDGERAVGMARTVTDGSQVVYIADVVVLPEYQGRGIGKVMMGMIIRNIKSSMKPGYFFNVVLMAAKGKEKFYSKLGFTELPSDTHGGAGMRLRMEEGKTP